ncbi:indole-3-acetate O-methyltransferase 1 [Oryza sativa Japonica Group]|jgi:indole-3-acetate O-methyltransferase|uniref:Indole-3-acetate O-methyltransferase 1 n=1 Tax=Oryza sativa subsp. japonica TaxID=39947 RepID=IAMT1_ORYSJ|nr:indole-3-acetate O-methyltransferase 1 [Oryza sativa Japonica Group]NP_001406849.1 indole-3-acetate O-methyltransferase 1 [Oryza sativa Japonica Group]Q0J998.1 RecName: Full=Indole-3-acetate O-methyltransferase 1; AltName: Full=IAA carboxylmethyltransferase 1; AltName: Full=OsSABATH4; AltName: Full=S-adenosyl-L-methionine:(indol-3-yl) acetate carboxylmethyltransferase 1 [Oryza sativa Japonica Group]ABZ04474.1 indole-3-acetic acid methyltransferase [Oryza sativa Japonica Group]KAF2936373.1 hy|eukprot:NP_001054175.1 Os04g0665200 [Oryza sativa Japonica Group]
MTMAMASMKGENVTVSAAAAPRMKKLASMLCMKGGNGDGSYLNNSQAQALHARRMLHFLEETLDAMMERSSSDKLFTAADLGCSCGSNSLFIVDVIVRRVSEAYESRGRDAPEFQVFFSDLPSNDFNTLFQLLPPLLAPVAGSLEECLAAGEGAATATRPYHAAGVPGTFYGRLFPGESIDVFTSTFSLHWLSQVPEEVGDSASPAYNGGRVFVHRATEAVAAAYKRQFQADLARFLRSRAREMKRGGAMFLACLGRSSGDPADQGGAGLLFGTHFQDAWDDLVQEGVVEGEKRDSFNIPVYAPSLQEFRDVVRADGAFAIDRLELVRGGSPLVVDRPDDAAEVGRAMANSCKAVAGVLVDAHIGERRGAQLFERLERRAARHARELVEKMHFFHVVCSLSLAP